eukprot:TRINITY_DN45502_c0_g1_i1.p1 TRINITY_DN45502_c0_g1~~TRINITY_DN45502_c0_g1_i1.p1  ORF type:complete len:754 (+),score=79.11 TRINITY_DN45502_c0_g1_i1:131-2392(+)
MTRIGRLYHELMNRCTQEFQTYLRMCSNFTDRLFASLHGDASAEKGCPHPEFACMLGDAQERTLCVQQCPVGVVFALWATFLQTATLGNVNEAKTLLTGVEVFRMFLPRECQGDLGDVEGGCEPLLAQSWFADSKHVLFELTDTMAARELRPAEFSKQRQAQGRSVAVVTAYHSASGTWSCLGNVADVGDDNRGDSNVVRSGITSNADSHDANSGIATYPQAHEASSNLKGSFGVRNDSSPCNGPWSFPWYLHNKRCYAEYHGYNFVFDTRPPTIDLNAHIDGYRYGIHWIKLASIRSALVTYDWVFWIDFDALFANFTQALDEFIDVVERHTSVDLVVQDSCQLINPNAFLLRSSAWSFRFLDTWESFGRMPTYGRSKMWELRCFNCAVVDQVLTATFGKRIHSCGEGASHLFMLRRLLELHGFGCSERSRSPAVGKVYFWQPNSNRLPRGFAFNVNDRERQFSFSQVELYHVGDLSIHWPSHDKGTHVMRRFANGPAEVGDDDGSCVTWRQPRIDLQDAYQPMGLLEEPPIFAPKQLVALVARLASPRIVVRVAGADDIHVVEQVLAAVAETNGASVEILVEAELTVREMSAWGSHPSSKLHFGASFSLLPTQVMNCDFIYVGVSNKRAIAAATAPAMGLDAEIHEQGDEEELTQEIKVATTRLRQGGFIAVPIDGCWQPVPATATTASAFAPNSPNLTPDLVDWRWTRASGCIWAYSLRPVQTSHYFHEVANAPADIAMERPAVPPSLKS